jgi:predicted oxidoreductase (fatty acid repression mutant protein)
LQVPLQASRTAAFVIIAVWIGLALVALGAVIRYFAPTA